MQYNIITLSIRIVHLSYRDRTEIVTQQGVLVQLDNAAVSDFLVLWLFAVSCPALLVFTFINIFGDHACYHQVPGKIAY